MLQHIRARRGKEVPVKDGRKIALVLYGGGMSGVAGAGAMIALQDLGLSHAFDAIYTYSAGFPNASYLLADETRVGTSIYYEDLAGKRFINLWRFWRIMDIRYLVKVMRERKRLPVDRILEASTQLYVRLWRLRAGRTQYVEAHRFGHVGYLKLMAAATSLRHVAIGPTKLGRDSFEDYPFSRDLPEHAAYGSSTGATDVLVIYNRPDQRQARLTSDERILEVVPDVWVKNTCTNPDDLRRTAESMVSKVYQLFGDSREPKL